MIRLFILLLHILATPLAAAPVMYAPAAQALYAGAVDGTGPQPGSAEYETWRADTTTMAQAIGGVAGYLLSSSEAANVSAAADIAQSGFENNYLTHAEQARLEAATANCLAGDELACKQRDDIIALDLARDELLELCVGDASALCQQQRAHLALTAADWIAQAQAGNSADLSPEGVLQRHWALIQLQKHAAETDLASVVANQSAVLDLLNDGNIDTSLLDLDQISTSLGAPGVGVSDLADIFLSGDHDAINATLVVPNIMGLVVGGSQIGTGGPRPIGPRGSTGIVPEIKFPKVAKRKPLKPLVDPSTNVASTQRTQHILYGDGPNSGGHLWPGQAGKTPFPQDWGANKVMSTVSDIATDPNLLWKPQSGNGGLYTKAGNPARFIVTDANGNLPIVDGVPVKVVIEPAGEGIITAFPNY